MNKQDYRIKYAKIRQEITNRVEKDCKICENVLNLLHKISYSTIFCYVSFNNEVDTQNFIRKIYLEKQLFVPFTKDGVMLLSNYDDSLPFKVDKLGNMIGINRGKDIVADVTIVPMLAFSHARKRLGYGGGYYDKYLSTHKTISIGIAYDEQFIDKNIFLEHDETLNYIVTPNMILGE